jgi:predicted outer membrane lipoprotein
VRYPESSQGVLALVLGILSVVSLPVLGPVAWWLGLADTRAVDAGRRDPSGRGAAVAGHVLGIIGTVILGLGVLALVLALAFGVIALLALPFVARTDAAEDPASVLERFDQSDTAGLSDTELREQWLAALPRETGSDGSDDAPDRLAWLDEQFRDGMSPQDVTRAVGDPDSVRARDDGEVWLWNLGVCSFLDYDTYELVFEDDELTGWRHIPG